MPYFSLSAIKKNFIFDGLWIIRSESWIIRSYRVIAAFFVWGIDSEGLSPTSVVSGTASTGCQCCGTLRTQETWKRVGTPTTGPAVLRGILKEWLWLSLTDWSHRSGRNIIRIVSDTGRLGLDFVTDTVKPICRYDRHRYLCTCIARRERIFRIFRYVVQAAR